MSYIKKVNQKNIVDISFKDMMEGLEPYVLEELPEGAIGDADALQQIDEMIGRLANLYAYMMSLWARVADHANTLKLLDAQSEYTIMMRKRDALYELARAVRYKHEAASRMLTAHQELEGSNVPFDRADHEGRKMRTWGAVSD